MTAEAPLVLAERETPFWGFGEMFAVIALAFVVFMLAGTVAAGLLHDSARIGYWAVVEESFAYLLIFGAIKILFAMQGRPLLPSLAFVRSSFEPMTLIVTGLSLLFLSGIITALARTPEVDTPFQQMISDTTASRIVIAIFGITLGPLIEELLFRGFMQPVLTSALGVLPGILITSAVFGGLHMQQNANLWQSGLVISLAGFGFGVIRHISGSTRASTLTHIAYNAVPCIATLLQTTHK